MKIVFSRRGGDQPGALNSGFVLVQISRGLIKSQLAGREQFSKIVKLYTVPPLNIVCPFICGVVNGPLPMYVNAV